LFYSTQIPACLWFLARDRSNGLARNAKLRDRRNEVLFIDARKMGVMVDRTRKELTNDDINLIARTYHAWRGEGDAGVYEDVPGFAKSATLDDIKGHGHVLTPGRYVGAEDVDEDETPFTERFTTLNAKLESQFEDGERLQHAIRANLQKLLMP
jgi:type I restriction enzyme M protein